jgi:site-specific DNA recombinase
VKVILHNPFYAGLSKHKGELHPGPHVAIISQETIDLVQVNLRKNSGRFRTLALHPEREYLLKGITRCAYCSVSMWSQTYKSGYR